MNPTFGSAITKLWVLTRATPGPAGTVDCPVVSEAELVLHAVTGRLAVGDALRMFPAVASITMVSVATVSRLTRNRRVLAHCGGAFAAVR